MYIDNNEARIKLKELVGEYGPEFCLKFLAEYIAETLVKFNTNKIERDRCSKYYIELLSNELKYQIEERI